VEIDAVWYFYFKNTKMRWIVDDFGEHVIVFHGFTDKLSVYSNVSEDGDFY